MTTTSQSDETQSASTAKPLVIRAAIVAIVAAGSWYGLARPLVMRVMEQRATLHAMEQALARNAATEVSDAEIDRIHGELQGRVSRIEAWTLRPEASGRLYESLRGLAKQAAVRIERIEPKGESVLGSAVKQKDGEKQAVVGQTLGYSLEVSGTYEAVAKFIAMCETELGSSRVVAFRISPSARPANGASQQVVATLETQHICLKVEAVNFPHKTAAVGDMQ